MSIYIFDFILSFFLFGIIIFFFYDILNEMINKKKQYDGIMDNL